MKIVHIFKNSNEKFFEPYITLINNHFNKNEHLFLIQGAKNQRKKIISSNVKFVERGSYIKLVRELYSAEKVILHALMSPLMLFILFLQPWLLKKCYWVIWGGDLYHFVKKKRTIKAKLFELIRRKAICNMGGLITHVKGDYELAKKWYGAKGKYYYSFLYPSNLYKEYNLSTVKIDRHKKYIQIGNSADPSNNHIEILESLLQFKDENFEIICPLSYGDNDYANYVIKKGKELFGAQFTPLTEFMPFEEYLQLLAKIDIAIFNHRRQQGIGNLTTLLGLGKKVYIRDDITTWEFCEEHGLKVFSTNNDFKHIFEPLEANVQKINQQNIKKHFSKENLINDWSKIFYN